MDGLFIGMDTQPPLAKPKQYDRSRGIGLACCILLTGLTGCQQWPGTQAMRQYQVESDRLLSEFRSQKKRAEELEQRNLQLEKRLGETERMIAKLQGRPSSRSAASGDRTLADISNNPSLGGSTRRINGPGLPDSTPATPSRLTSGGYHGGEDLKGDPSRSNQWRPITGR